MATTILAIVRDGRTRRLIVAALRGAGFSVRAAEDVRAALPLLGGEQFDVVVADGSVQNELRMFWPGAVAIVDQPLDAGELVRAVRARVRGSRILDMRAVRRFVASVPSLRDTLAAPIVSPDEWMLRGEMRRTMSELSGVFRTAADDEPNDTRAAVFIAAAMVAAQLASVRAPGATGH